MKLSDLSEIDRSTLHLRGGSGRFKPENDDEFDECRRALAAGATLEIDLDSIEDLHQPTEP